MFGNKWTSFCMAGILKENNYGVTQNLIPWPQRPWILSTFYSPARAEWVWLEFRSGSYLVHYQCLYYIRIIDSNNFSCEKVIKKKLSVNFVNTFYYIWILFKNIKATYFFTLFMYVCNHIFAWIWRSADNIRCCLSVAEYFIFEARSFIGLDWSIHLYSEL